MPPFSLKMNHVAMSMPPAEIAGSRREELLAFYGRVFKWTEYQEDESFNEQFAEELTALVGEKVETHPPLVMLTGIGFVFLYGLPRPMVTTPVDHFGFEVDTEEELDTILERAREWAKDDPDVRIVDKAVSSYEIEEALQAQYPAKKVDLVNTYIGYRMPMAVEVQWYRWYD